MAVFAANATIYYRYLIPNVFLMYKIWKFLMHTSEMVFVKPFHWNWLTASRGCLLFVVVPCPLAYTQQISGDLGQYARGQVCETICQKLRNTATPLVSAFLWKSPGLHMPPFPRQGHGCKIPICDVAGMAILLTVAMQPAGLLARHNFNPQTSDLSDFHQKMCPTYKINKMTKMF